MGLFTIMGAAKYLDSRPKGKDKVENFLLYIFQFVKMIIFLIVLVAIIIFVGNYLSKL